MIGRGHITRRVSSHHSAIASDIFICTFAQSNFRQRMTLAVLRDIHALIPSSNLRQKQDVLICKGVRIALG